jgi:ACS family allantoate permease-like MFS transporter
MSDKVGTPEEKTVTELKPSSAPGTPPDHGRDYRSNADDALQLIESGGLGPVDPERSRRLLRRIDLYVMPLICTYVTLT